MKLLKRMKCSLWTDIDQPENEMSEKQNKAQNKMYNKLAFNYQKKRERERENVLSPEEYTRHDDKGFLWEQGLPLWRVIQSLRAEGRGKLTFHYIPFLSGVPLAHIASNTIKI